MRSKFSLLYLVLALAMSTPASAALKIFACEPEWDALAREIGGDKVKSETATTALQDVHHIEARPSLIAKVRSANLLVCTGADLEVGWLPMLVRQAGNREVQPGRPGYFLAADAVDRLDIPTHVDRAMGDVHPFGNPHIHLHPHRMAQVAAALAQRLAQVDPSNADYYAARHADFAKRWDEATKRWELRAGSLKGVSVVVQHRSWSYLFNWLQIQEAAAIEPKPGVPPSAGYLTELKAKLVAHPARFIVRATYQDPKAANWLAKELGIAVVDLPYSVGGSAKALDLFSLFDETVDRLVAANK